MNDILRYGTYFFLPINAAFLILSIRNGSAGLAALNAGAVTLHIINLLEGL